MASLTGPVTACALGLLCALAPGPALTAPCGGDFNAWLEDFSKEALKGFRKGPSTRR
jgi:hypothetical protein